MLDSSAFISAGETFTNINVFAFPPKESFINMVSLLSQYGMKPPFPSPKIAMTFPKAERDLLIAFASLSLSSVAPVFETHSEPAKSTSESFPTVLYFV